MKFGDINILGELISEQIDKINDNIILNAFRTAINGSLSQFNMVDGIVDEYEDESGIDTSSSTNEFYNETEDYYYNYTPGGIDSYTKLMIHGEGLDSSISHPITFHGTAQLDTAQKKLGDSSLLLDGNSDYLTIPDSTDWNFGTDDFTIDFWVRPNDADAASYHHLISQYEYGTQNWIHLRLNGSEIRFNVKNSTQVCYYYGNHGMSDNTWHHIALVRNGTNVYIFIDGSSISLTAQTPISTNSMPNLTSNLHIGGADTIGYYFGGYMDEIRISKGIARWTSNFTPSTAQYEPDEYTALLLHFDGDDEATDSVDVSGGDESGNNHKVTYNGDAQLDDAQKKLGDSSILFDGTGDYLSIADSSDFEFGSDDFTMEMFVRFDTVNAQNYLITKYAISGGGRSFLWRQEDDQMFFSFGNNTSDGNSYTSSWTPSEDTWYHVAVVRSGTSLYFFVDGTQIGTTKDVTGDSCYNGTIDLCIGRISDDNYGALDGWVDEVRISKGIARWTSNFTPPTSPYSSEESIYNISLQSDSFTAEAEPDSARIVILEEDVDSVILNTDLKAWVSRDDGTTWTQGTLTYEGDYDSSKRILAADFDISGQPSGTDMEYKLTSHNENKLKIHGTGLSWG